MRINTVQDVQKAIVQAEKNYIRRMSKYDWFKPNERPFTLSMRLLKRTGTFKQSNDRCTFDPIKMQAYSYGWWRFVDRIGGKVVFNTLRYSLATGEHQSKVWRMLRDLGIKVDVEVEVPKGLQDLSSGVRMYEGRIQELVALMQNPRSRKDTNKARANTIRLYQNKIEVLNSLIAVQGRN